MEYGSLKELYISLLPVFNVKKRLFNYEDKTSITNEDIWKYLTITKWKSSYDLCISDMVNDIILVDGNDILKFKGDAK